MESMGKKVSWSWSSAAIGAATAAAATSLLSAKPKDPTFHLISIDLTSLKLNLPVLDAELMLTVHVTNPNIAAIHYSSTTMSILYEGTVLGTAEVKAGSQPARSCQLLKFPARLDGMELAQHARRFFADVANREMKLEAKLDIEGAAKVLWWDHSFKIKEVVVQSWSLQMAFRRVLLSHLRRSSRPACSSLTPPHVPSSPSRPSIAIALFQSRLFSTPTDLDSEFSRLRDDSIASLGGGGHGLDLGEEMIGAGAANHDLITRHVISLLDSYHDLTGLP